jgi:hypothetical protein
MCGPRDAVRLRAGVILLALSAMLVSLGQPAGEAAGGSHGAPSAVVSGTELALRSRA